MPFRAILKSRLPLAMLFVCLSLVRGFSYSVIVPPWQAPDEPGHVEYARLLAEKGLPLAREDISLQLQREILSSLHDFDFWQHVHQPEPEQLPESFRDDPFLVRSGTQVGDEPPLYYLIPALIFALLQPQSVLLQLYVMRWFSVLLSSLVVVVAYLTAEELFHDDRFLVVGVPIFVAFLPMFTFIGASANNDSMAALLASLAIYSLVRALKTGLSPRSAFLVALFVVLSVSCKKTTLFTIPLAALALPICDWRPGGRWRPDRRHAIGAACLACLVVIWGLWQWDGPDAEGWVQSPQRGMRVRSTAHARSGLHSFRLEDDGSSEARFVVYVVPANTVEQIKGQVLTLSAWVRNSEGGHSGYLAIHDSAGATMRPFDTSELWTPQEVRRLISPQVNSVWVALGAGLRPSDEQTADVYFDDVALLAGGGRAVGAGNLLSNGSAEFPALRLGPLTRIVARHVSLSRLLSSDTFSPANLERYSLYVLLAFAGFWANFGWLTIPLDLKWYALVAALALVSLVGLGRGVVRVALAWSRQGHGLASWRPRALVLLFIAVSLTILQVFLPMFGQDWQPQGRYMFPAIVPVATLFTLGWREVVPTRWRGVLIVPWVAAFVALDLLCAVGYLGPHYYR
jgi:4-amino-4-deoxy-L-arabinose transferase-like glycosyltransferase